MNWTTSRTATLALGDAVVLAVVHPAWGPVLTGLSAPRAWLGTDPDIALTALCEALLWLSAAWIAVGLLAGLGTRLPGATGRVCARCVRVVVPQVLLRVVLGSTGLGLLAAPAAHAMAPAGDTPVPGTGVRVAATSTWVHPAAASTWLGAGLPSPDWPLSPSVPPPTPPTSAAPTPSTIPTTPAPAPPTSGAAAPTNRPTTSSARASTTRVHPGDSLWLLAARRLGPAADSTAVAHYWPQIYAANRAVIGDDPAAIHPGQVVHLPVPTTQESP